MDSLKAKPKNVKDLEFEKTEADCVIATHEATIQDMCSSLDGV